MNFMVHPNVVIPQGVEQVMIKEHISEPSPDVCARMDPTTLANLVWDAYCSGGYLDVQQYVRIDG